MFYVLKNLLFWKFCFKYEFFLADLILTHYDFLISQIYYGVLFILGKKWRFRIIWLVLTLIEPSYLIFTIYAFDLYLTIIYLKFYCLEKIIFIIYWFSHDLLLLILRLSLKNFGYVKLFDGTAIFCCWNLGSQIIVTGLELLSLF